MAANSIRSMADTNNLHMADSLMAATEATASTAVMAVMVMEAMVPRSFPTNLLIELSIISTERSVTMALVEQSITKPTLETSAFPRADKPSNPSTKDTLTLVITELALAMVPEVMVTAATEHNLPVLSVVSLATAPVVAMVAMETTTANATSTAMMSARRKDMVASLATAMAHTKT